MNINGTLRERFWDKVQTGPGCWAWLAHKNNKGYGMIQPGGKGNKVLAHRVAWVLLRGPIPEGKNVLHRCDNPQCTNPEHLFLGSHRDNMLDKHAKGRAYPEGWLENCQKAAKRRAKPKQDPKEGGNEATRFTSDRSRGEANVKAKLTASQVLELRAASAVGESYSKLALRFGITQGMVGHIVRRTCWTHI